MKLLNDKNISTNAKKKFNKLIEPNINNLYKFICAYTGDVVLSQDLLQECLIKAYLNIDSLKDEKKIKSWLFCIATNCAKDYFKKNKLQFELQMEVADEINRHYEIEMKQDITQFLLYLNSDERKIIILKDMLGYSYCEIADILCINESNVGVQLYRARDKFKEIIIKSNYLEKRVEL
jgi:RNA polymerase sigma-70 factor (ECF subfamily)